MLSFDTAGPGTPKLDRSKDMRMDHFIFFTPGQAFIVAKGAKNVPDRFFKFQVGLLPEPESKLAQLRPTAL